MMIAILAMSVALIALAYAADLRALTCCLESMFSQRAVPRLAGLTSLGIRSARSLEVLRHLRDLPADPTPIRSLESGRRQSVSWPDASTIRLCLTESAPEALHGRLAAVVTQEPGSVTFSRDGGDPRVARKLGSAFAPLMKEVSGAAYRPELGGIVAALDSAEAILWVACPPGEPAGVGEIMQVRSMAGDLERRLLRAANERGDGSLALAMQLHDLATPLANAKLALCTSTCVGCSTPKAVALRSLEALERMIEDLSTFSSSGEAPLETDTFDVGTLVTETVAEFWPSAEKKGLLLKGADASCPILASADRAHVRRIVSNLLSNAIKMTSRGTIAVSCERKLDKVAIHVKDTGPGLSDKQLAALFVPFSRPHGDRIPGSGLGLAVARSLAERNGGDLCAFSLPGNGCDFVLTLPAVERSNAVLIVDDDADLAGTLAETFRSAGYRASVATSVREALCLLEDEPPDLIVTDWAMPDGGGARIAESASRIPVIVLSGAAAGSLGPAAERCLVLEKGCDPQEILRAAAKAYSE